MEDPWMFPSQMNMTSAHQHQRPISWNSSYHDAWDAQRQAPSYPSMRLPFINPDSHLGPYRTSHVEQIYANISTPENRYRHHFPVPQNTPRDLRTSTLPHQPHATAAVSQFRQSQHSSHSQYSSGYHSAEFASSFHSAHNPSNLRASMPRTYRPITNQSNRLVPDPISSRLVPDPISSRLVPDPISSRLAPRQSVDMQRAALRQQYQYYNYLKYQGERDSVMTYHEEGTPRACLSRSNSAADVVVREGDEDGQESPLMFSRNTSLDSLYSFEDSPIRSSVTSEFSHQLSKSVSASELPDSPGEIQKMFKMEERRKNNLAFEKLAISSNQPAFNATYKPHEMAARSDMQLFRPWPMRHYQHGMQAGHMPDRYNFTQGMQNTKQTIQMYKPRSVDVDLSRVQFSQRNIDCEVSSGGDTIHKYAVEDTPFSLSRNPSYKSLTMEPYAAADAMASNHDVTVIQVPRAASQPDHLHEYATEDTPGLVSLGSPLSSITTSTSDSQIARDAALLQECINSAMPKPRNSNQKFQVSVSLTRRSTPSGSSTVSTPAQVSNTASLDSLPEVEDEQPVLDKVDEEPVCEEGQGKVAASVPEVLQGSHTDDLQGSHTDALQGSHTNALQGSHTNAFLGFRNLNEPILPEITRIPNPELYRPTIKELDETKHVHVQNKCEQAEQEEENCHPKKKSHKSSVMSKFRKLFQKKKKKETKDEEFSVERDATHANPVLELGAVASSAYVEKNSFDVSSSKVGHAKLGWLFHRRSNSAGQKRLQQDMENYRAEKFDQKLNRSFNLPSFRRKPSFGQSGSSVVTEV